MGDTLPSLSEINKNASGHSAEELTKLRSEAFLGCAAILLHQRGHLDAAALLIEATYFELEYQGEDWHRDQYQALLDVDPQTSDRFTEEIQSRILSTMNEIAERDHSDVRALEVRTILPSVSSDWREQLKGTQSPTQSNHARRVRMDPRHPVEDGLHFTNSWEHKVYIVLKEHQKSLPDNDTIGIVPLGAVKVRDAVLEPDFLVTYRGRVGIIEVDGPYHKGQISNDKSRERLLRHAGIKLIDRIDVQDATNKEEVQKFVVDFLRQFES